MTSILRLALRLRLLALLLLTSALVACGGGGSSSAQAAEPEGAENSSGGSDSGSDGTGGNGSQTDGDNGSDGGEGGDGNDVSDVGDGNDVSDANDGAEDGDSDAEAGDDDPASGEDNGPDSGTSDDAASDDTDTGAGEDGASEDDSSGDENSGDGDGAAQGDNAGPPSVEILFPCDGCRATTPELSVNGRALRPDAEDNDHGGLTVRVSAGHGDVSTVTEEDGYWLANDLALLDPVVGPEPFTITATASDPVEGQGEAADISLENYPTFTRALFAPDTERSDFYYFLETFAARDRLLRYDDSSEQFELINQWSGSSPFESVVEMVFDASASRLLVLDSDIPALLVIDAESGATEELSGPNSGAGPALSSPLRMAIDEDSRRVIVWDEQAEMLMSIDLGSGERSIIADNTGRGTGPDLAGQALALDPGSDTAYLFPGETVLAVSLEDGSRSALPEDGDRLSDPSTAVFDPDRERLVSWRAAGRNLVTIDPSDGSTQVLGSIGGGEQIHYGHQLSYHRDQYFINDYSFRPSQYDSDFIATVNPNNGELEVFVGDRFSPDFAVERPAAFAMEHGEVRRRMFVLDSLWNDGAIYSVDVQSNFVGNGYGPDFSLPEALVMDWGEFYAYILEPNGIQRWEPSRFRLATISSDSRGTGPELMEAVGMVEGPEGNLLVVDRGRGAVVAVDPVSGDRSIVSDHNDPGEPFVWANSLSYEEESNTLVVGDADESGGKLLRVNLETGARTVVSGPNRGGGTPMRNIADVVLLAGAEQAMISDRDRILRVDLQSGNREVISSLEVGRGEAFVNIGDIEVDPRRERIYGWSVEHEALLMFDLNSGDRVVVTK